MHVWIEVLHHIYVCMYVLAVQNYEYFMIFYSIIITIIYNNIITHKLP